MRLLSLFDTGSPSSFIKRKFVTKAMPMTKLPTNLRGLGGHRLHIYGRIVCRVQFNEQIFSLTIAVVPDDAMICPLILGRDFLNAFSIKLTKQKKLSYARDELMIIKEKIEKMPSFAAPSLNETSSNLLKHSLLKPPEPLLPILSPLAPPNTQTSLAAPRVHALTDRPKLMPTHRNNSRHRVTCWHCCMVRKTESWLRFLALIFLTRI